jgi:mono/diheme cytochrome c family protein
MKEEDGPTPKGPESMSRGLLTLLFMVAGTALAAEKQDRSPTAAEAAFFEKRVRPVLAEHCLSCHGPKKQRSGLRLDSRAALLRGGDNGPVVFPGEPDRSPLIQAVRHQGERKMPPKQKLDRAQTEALALWVKMGVPWPDAGTSASQKHNTWKTHWAFRPVSNPRPPAVRQSHWVRTSVDRFILARLEAKGLSPSPEADRRTLIRRATFDLLGLPPTPEEVEAFVKDTSADAWEKVVDRLLASPHHGERWARHWLDVARYADTKGYVFFQEKEYPWAWTYRDYVIRVFNEDLPYDRFIREQLAADRLIRPGGRPDTPVGPRVKSALPTHTSGKPDTPVGPTTDKSALAALGFLTLGGRFMNNVHDILDDRIDVVTRGLLGLTVTCARCHDHKFDPIPQADYYSLYGVFASSVEPTVPPLFTDPPRTAAYAAFEKEMKAREKKLTDFIREKHAQVVDGARKRAVEYLLAAHAMRDQPDTEEFMLLADGNDLNPTMVSRWRAYLRRTARNDSPVFRPWHALSPLPEKDLPARAHTVIRGLVDAKPTRPVNPLVIRALTKKPLKTMADVAKCYGALLNAIEARWQAVLKRAEKEGLPPPERLTDPAEEELGQVFHGPGAAPNIRLSQIADLDLLPDRPSQAQLQKLRKEVEQWRANGPGAPPRAMALVDLATPVEPRVFRRGSPNNLGPAVPRQFLEVLAGTDRKPFSDGSGRLELARAIANRDNPLTARVMVNRIWLHHFGAGLVRTPSDFGMRAEPPSHPELLDHLATVFMRGDGQQSSGWSVKRLHRLILTSAVYRQSSVRDQANGKDLDPENRLLWRMNRRRLDFESLRDALLAVSGRLDHTVGGPSVRDLLGVRANRRTLYGFLDRLNVPGLFRTFDFPSPDTTSPQRAETTVPQQALFLMNNSFARDCARRLLQRPDITETKDVPSRVARIYLLLYGRPPAGDEAALAGEYLGKAPTPADWEHYVHALLLTNEFAFVD